MKNRYWMKLRYGDGHERWELTAGKYASEPAVRRAYEARGKSLHFEIVEVRAEEQYEFGLED
tara:strand:+ start:1106 stop:1291 length:186 start_codon:yes stop_codon:yes gene_type:complete